MMELKYLEFRVHGGDSVIPKMEYSFIVTSTTACVLTMKKKCSL